MNIGIVGIGYWGPNLLRNLNNNKKFKVKYVCDLNRENLKKINSLDNGVIKKGFAADLCVFKREEWILEKNNIQSAGHNNPFIGKKFSTKVKKTIRKGRVVYENK